jgi:2-polyprenyl-3-methyl-5-hydroxy-6-metoxy-1,4-benzoquinol methylase
MPKRKLELAEHELECLQSCDLCGSASREAKELFIKYGLPVVRCPRCGLLYVNPRLRQDLLWQRYSNDYFLNEYLPVHGTYDELANYHAHAGYLNEISLYVPARGRLFDVGCATGLFLAAARLDNWDVMGNELNSFAADYALQNFNIQVLAGNFETLDLPKGSFDAVTMWETIEHVESPRRVLRKAAELVHPGGVLALSTPNAASLSFRFLQDRWWIMAPREHLFYFTPKTITDLLNQTGFEVKKLYTVEFDFQFFRKTLLGQEVAPWHLHLTEMRPSNDAPAPQPAPVWSKLKTGVLKKIARIIYRQGWADRMFIYATRRT